MSMKEYPSGSAVAIVITQLKRRTTGAVITNATITVQVRDPSLAAIGTSITLTAVGDGNYYGSLPASIDLLTNTHVYLDININGGTSELTSRILQPRVVRVRSE